MSGYEKDSVRDCLFSEQDMKLHNIRFARGGAEVIEEADFRAEICSAAEQRRNSTAKLVGWPKVTRPTVDVAEFLANI